MIVLQLHLAALASLKGDIVELNKRLQQTERERDLLEKKLAKAQVSDGSRSWKWSGLFFSNRGREIKHNIHCNTDISGKKF